MTPGSTTRPPTTRHGLAVLRWWLLAGLALAVLSAPTFLDVALPWQFLLAVLLLLAGFNLRAMRATGPVANRDAELVRHLVVDLTGLGVMLFLTGGVANPLVSLLLLPVTVAALSLSPRWTGGVAAYAIAIYSFLMLYSLPLAIADAERATRLHLGGMWLTFVVSAALLAWIVARMTASVRTRDAQLAAARETALRDAQVVALGQLAAGAAHELGTPLATMNILAGELAQDARLPGEARDDLGLLLRQIAICKDIVSGLVRQAGVDRAGTVKALPLRDWLTGVLARWHTLWPQATCVLDLRGADLPVVAVEAGIEQALVNLLNNAAKASHNGLRIEVARSGELMNLAVCDRGPGFPPEILASAGSAPLEPHAEGAGVGLWLTRAAIERAGGVLRLENTATGGKAIIALPLGSMGVK